MPLLETFANASARGFFTGGPADAANSYELISSAYGNGSLSTITFSSIPSTYKHLQLRITTRGTRAFASDQVSYGFNGDVAGSSYSEHRLAGNGSSVFAENATSRPFLRLEDTPGSTATANVHSAFILDILDYASTSKYKTVRNLQGAPASNRIWLTSGLWMSTAAINSIAFTILTNPFTSTTRFSLYGIKG